MSPSQRSPTMRYTPILIAILFLTASAHADECIEFCSKPINVVPPNESVELGNELGHILAFFVSNGASTHLETSEEPPYKIEIGSSGNYGDDGIGKDQGYNKFIFTDGSYYFEGELGEGEDGRTTGNAEYYGGSGRFEAMASGSKYDGTSLSERFICDTHGVIERL